MNKYSVPYITHVRSQCYSRQHIIGLRTVRPCYGLRRLFGLVLCLLSLHGGYAQERGGYD